MEEIWKGEWAAKGQDPPTEQRLDDTYVAAGEDEETAGGETVSEEDLVSSETQMGEKWSGGALAADEEQGNEEGGEGRGRSRECNERLVWQNLLQ